MDDFLFMRDEWINCCKGRRAACPHIKFGADEVRIRDDFDNEVVMSLQQFSDLVQTGQRRLVACFPPTLDEVD